MNKFELVLIVDPALEAEFEKDVRKTIVHSSITGVMELRGVKDGVVYASVVDSNTLYEVPLESILSDNWIAQVVNSDVIIEDGIEEDTPSVLVRRLGILYQRNKEFSTYRTLSTGTVGSSQGEDEV